MDSIPYLLAVVVALLGALGLALGRRRPPPAPPVAVASTVAEQHARTVERLEVDARAVVAEASHVDALPGAERNRAIGRGLRER